MRPHTKHKLFSQEVGTAEEKRLEGLEWIKVKIWVLLF